MGSSERQTYYGQITSKGGSEDLPGPGMYTLKLPPGRSVIIDKNEKG
jgi:hypothetical protein